MIYRNALGVLVRALPFVSVLFAVILFLVAHGASAQIGDALDITDIPRSVPTPVATPEVVEQSNLMEDVSSVLPDAAVGEVVSNMPYPVAEVKVSRQDATSSSFYLHIDNYNIGTGGKARPRSQTWLVAGARGRIPTVHVQSAEFALVKDGKVTTTTAAVPTQLRQSFARISDLGQFRQYWLYTLTVTLSAPSTDDGTWVCKNASVLLNIGQPTGTLSPGLVERFALKEDDADADPLPKALLLNPDISPDYYSVDYGDPIESFLSWNDRLLAAAETKDMFRLHVYKGGFYRISADDLNGVSGGEVSAPATAWRVFHGGREIPVLADPDKPREAVYLPVARDEKDILRREVYWVDTSGRGAGDSTAPVRYNNGNSVESVAAASVDEPQTTGTFRLRHRELIDYNPRLREDARNDRWSWAELSTGRPVRLELTMPPFYNSDSTGTVKAEVRYGFSNFPPVVPKLVMVTTDQVTAETTLSAQMGTAELELPASALRPGVNEVALDLHYPPEGVHKRPVTIQLIETVRTQELSVPEGNSFFFETAPVTTAPLELANPLSRHGFLFNMQGALPVLIELDGRRVPGGGSQVQYLLADVNDAEPVSDIDCIEDPLSIREMASARSIIITAPEVEEAVGQLRETQEARGVDVQVFRTLDIYDNFAFGNHDPVSIQRAMRYLFYRAEGLPPEYLTLVGEASAFRGDPSRGPENVQRDMLPSSMATRPDAIQGDEKYATSIGDDNVADFVVGRIPAGGPDELRGYLNKMEVYADEPAGEWSRRTLFVMDDNVEFPDVVSDIVQKSLSPAADNSLLRQWDYEYVPYLRVPGKKRSWQATDAVVDSFNDGLSILNFFGHGGPNLWSHERLFHLNDLPRVQNGGRLPLVTCASCDNAWITYPMPPVNESMGELLVLKPDGGAIGLFGPVAGASPYEHSTLVQSLMEALLRAQLRRAGEATFYAKSMYFAITRSTSIPDQYLLLGDPTVQLKIPVVEPLLLLDDDIRLNPDRPTRTMVRLESGVTLMSTGTLTVKDATTDEVLAEVQVRPRHAGWQINLPASYQGGALMAMLEWEDEGKLRYGGGIGRVWPREPDPRSGGVTLKSLEDNGFEIRAAENVPAGSSRSMLNFEIRPSSDATSSKTVRLSAISGSKPLGVPSTINVGTTETFTWFSLPPPPEDAEDREILVIASQEPNPDTVATFDPPAKAVADLEFVPGTARVYSLSDRMLSGATVVFEAELRNIGTTSVPIVPLHARMDDPSTGTELVSINESSTYRIPGFEPGESRKVQFRWEQSSRGVHNNIFLVVNSSRTAVEGDYSNNYIAMPEFEVIGVGDFKVDELEVSPAFASMGSSVTVTAVFSNDNMPADRPVAYQLGWQRAFDGASTSTVDYVQFVDGYATVTQEIIAPEGFTQLFITINSDRDIEEANAGNNTARTPSMIAFDLPNFQRSINLATSLEWGQSYNVGMPFEAQLQVLGDLSSHTLHVLPTIDEVTAGRAVPQDVATDDAWQVGPWRVAASASENPGPISFATEIPQLHRDMPGVLRGHFTPFNADMPVKVSLDEGATWHQPADRGMNTNLRVAEFGIADMKDGRINWSMDKGGTEGIGLVHLSFYPQAMQWDSVPYMLPAELQSRELNFAIDLNEGEWQKLYVEWRSGEWTGNDVLWAQWNSGNEPSVIFKAGEFVQFRVIGVPEEGQKPFLHNFRISR